MAIKGLPFPTFAPPQGGGGITQVKMAPSQVRFPTARTGGGTYQPETIESVGGLLGFGADSLLKGLGGIFGQSEEEKNDEYLKSLADIENDDVREAQLQAYSIYGRPEDKDSFGLDEIANLVIASQMGSGSDEYIKGVLDSKKTTEASRLQTQIKRQSYINTQLAPVSLQNLRVRNKETGEVSIANYNPKKGILTNLDGVELDSSLYGPELENKNFNNYEDINVTKSSGISTPTMGYFDQTTNTHMVYDPDHPEATSKGYRDASLPYADGSPSNFVRSNAQTNQTLADTVNDPDFNAYEKRLGGYREQDANSMSMISAALAAMPLFDAGIEDAAMAPSTFVAGMFSMGNNIYQNIKQVGAASSGTDFDGFFALDDAEDDGGYGRGGSGQAAKRLYYAYDVVPEGEVIKGETQFSKAQMKEIEEAERIFEESTGVSIAQKFEGLSGYLGDMAYANIRVRGILLGLAYQAAAANGQTGRTLSDKDLAYHLEMVGFGKASTPQTQKDILIDFIDQVVDSADNKIRINLPRETLPANELIADRRYQLQTSTFYTPPQKGLDQNGNPIYDWAAGPNAYTYKTFNDRYGNMPDVKKWNTFDSPGRRLKEGRKREDRMRKGGVFSKFGNERQPAY